MSIRLIAVDIDGTLMPSSGSTISRRNLAALRSAEVAGIEIVIATGRRQAYAMPLIAQVGLSQRSIMISSNGAVVRRLDGEILERRFLPADVARQLCAKLRGYGTIVFTFDREGSAALVIEDLERVNSRLQRWVEANRRSLAEIRPLERAFDGDVLPIQGMVCGSVAEIRLAEAELRADALGPAVSTHRTEYEARDLGILDILPFGCSKGSALRMVAESFVIEQEQVMAIGDNFNDLEMLEYAGRGVLMANAAAEMLTMSQYRRWELAPSNDEDGVACAIESAMRGASCLESGNREAEERRRETPGSSSPAEDAIAGWTPVWTQ